MADRLTSSRVRSAWLFLTPMLVVLALVAAWPLIRTIWLSFTDANLLRMEQAKFIGFQNYVGKYGVLEDPLWRKAVWTTLKFTFFTVTIETLLGLAVALVLNRNFPGRGIVRAAVLVPWAIPTIVSAKMWSWMLNDQFGIINHIMLGLGIIDSPKAWTADPDLLMSAVVMVDVWKTTPFMALLILAALQMLPKECYEAAEIDGVHPVKVFFKVTLPLIRPALMVAIIFRALDAIRIFDLVYVLTGTREPTMTMSVYARQQLIEFQEVGFGSAASTFLFFIVAVLTVIYVVLGRVKLEGTYMTGKALAKKSIFYLLVVLIIIYAVFPFYYAVLSSLKQGTALFSVDYFPVTWDFGNYTSVFRDNPFATAIWNSVIVSFSTVALSLFLGLTAAYALARIHFRGRGLLLLTILGVSMFPQVAVLSGMFQMVRALGLYNHLPALILSYMIFTLPFTVWVLTTFMRELPKELEEAAILDGASSWVILTRVFMPLMWPALVTTGLLAFIAAWNEFLFALTFTLTNDQRTVPVSIALMSGASSHELPWGNIMAASVMVTLPLVLLVLIFQRRIVSGLTAGAVKG